MSIEVDDPQRCLTVPAESFIQCGAELGGLHQALAPAQLDPEERKQIDSGFGLPAECQRADTAARWLRACPAAAQAAGDAAAALQTATVTATATEGAIAGVASFQGGVRGAALVFLTTISLVPQALRDALGRRLTAGGLSDDERDGVAADLQALAAPMDSDAERAKEARLRQERKEDHLRTEVAMAEQEAEAGRARVEVVDAVRRGEALPPEVLLTLNGPAPAAPPPPRRRTRR